MIARRVFVALICTFLMGSLLFMPQGSISASSDNPDEQPPTISREDGSSSRKKLDKNDVPRAVEYMQAHEQHNLQPVEHAELLAPAAVDVFYIQPILFIPSDFSEDVANRPAIDETFQLLRRWYSGPLELNNSGYSFQVRDTIVYSASQPFSYYKCVDHTQVCDNYDGVWGNVQVELLNAGYPLWSDGTSHIVFVKGAGGWAGSNSSNSYTNWPAPGPASRGGFGILGDWALDSISGTTNAECYTHMGTACYQDPQRGAVGHELGHTFGLAHAMNVAGSLMYSWWNFPFTSLSAGIGNDEISVLRDDSPFFSPQACSPDDLVDQAVLPSTVSAGARFNASFAVTNYGFCRWSPTSTALYSVGNNVWGLAQKSLTVAVYPAQPYTFDLGLRAPSLRKLSGSVSYDCFWQMRTQKKLFGPRMGNTITVTK